MLMVRITIYLESKKYLDDPNAPITDTAEGMYDEDVATPYKYFGYGSLDVASPKRLQAAVEKLLQVLQQIHW